ncbi:hypothetical protein SETIT_8G069400v2 [Setaria italica]|uniref:Aspartic peptidase DDI1-type domain-containing protein n=1 Tax=Setaria italica TaxID=4555 RepID=A0A368S4Z1_SETIT|nr:hypothetical protein SETIT_8G069400v2 [Setaria italica]
MSAVPLHQRILLPAGHLAHQPDRPSLLQQHRAVLLRLLQQQHRLPHRQALLPHRARSVCCFRPSSRIAASRAYVITTMSSMSVATAASTSSTLRSRTTTMRRFLSTTRMKPCRSSPSMRSPASGLRIRGCGLVHSSRLQYKGAVLHALLDSSSTHNFINIAAACHSGMPIRPCMGLRVGIANGDKIDCEGRTLDVPITIGMEAFSISCYAIPLGSFDVILGVEYLRTLGPILWHFDDLCMAFWRGDRWVFCNTQRSTRGSNNQYKMTNYKFRCGVVVFTRRRNSYVVSPSLFYACYLGRRKVKEVKKNFRCGRRCSLLGRTSFRKDDGQIHVQASCKQ